MIKLVSISFLCFLILLKPFPGRANNRDKKSIFDIKNENKTILLFSSERTEKAFYFHNDSIHKLNFRYADRKRGIKPFIAPALLISGGTALHFMTNAKEHFRNFAQDNFAYHGHFDDYAQYAPLATVYALNALGIKGKNNFGNRTALAIKSILLNEFIVSNLKTWTHVQRPSGDARSFPSGHTSFAFAMAQIMHKEYGEISPWFSIGAYSCAATVGILRVAKNAHWISDVVAGAGIGMLSTELVYLTHQYKWDNEHLKQWDIFPFQMGNQKGLTLVYRF
ncbi:MAG TPA: phosphatase PAP2 family protein [Draconibacterium sp.]|nr:phosphatase PAP2 family protein [Draconibacterium sp.]